MKVFISGICGFVGTNLALYLQESGMEVIGCDRAFPKPHYERMSRALISCRVGDINVYRDCKKIIDPDTDVVIHLAAETDARLAFHKAGKMIRVNVEGTHNIIKAIEELGIKKFIFASSGAVYGSAHVDGSLKERFHSDITSLRPENIYGVSKIAGEYLTDLTSFNGCEGFILRLSNIYGPWCRRKKSVIAAALKYAAGYDDFTIHGTGEQVRDFIYVDDVSRVIEGIIEGRIKPGTYDIANGYSISINDLMEVIQDVTGIDDLPRDEEEFSGTQWVAFDSGKIAAHFDDWPITPLGRGLEETWAWVKDNLGR